MKKSITLILLPLAILAFITSAIVLSFQKYQPKVLKQLQEVRGIRTDQYTNIPCPIDCQKISVSSTGTNSQLTFKTKKTPQEVQKFYKNIYGDNYRIESQSEKEGVLVVKYKNNDEIITILSTQSGGEMTVGSVEILKD